MFSLLIVSLKILLRGHAFSTHAKFSENLIKENTCFKGKGSCVDLILTNRRFSFKHSNSYETGISDRHHLIHLMLKSNLSNSEPKLVTY